MIETFGRDVRYAMRWLRRSPGFSLVAILSLGLGIGFNSAIFAVVDSLLLRPLPVAAPDRLVEIYTSSPDGDTYATSSVPDYLDFAARAGLFDGIVGYSPMFAAVNRGDRARLRLGEVVTGSYFQVLGLDAATGRTLLPSDDVAGAPRVVVLSHAYWRRELGGDPGVIGRTLRIRGQVYDIVGVAPAGYTGMVQMLSPDLFIAVAHTEDVEPAGIQSVVPSPTGTSRLDRRGQRWLFLKGRLRPGVTADQAQANLRVVAAQLAAEHPTTNRDRQVSVIPTTDVRVHPQADGTLRWAVTGTMAAVGLVLLVACANVAGMLLARASARQREISVRMAVGASRGRLVRQLLTESVVLAGLGAAVGLAFAWWFTRLISTLNLPIPVPLAIDVSLDWRVLAFTAAAATATGVVAGLVPALRASKPDLVPELKGESFARRTGRRRVALRDGLVVAQVAVSAVLLVGAGLLLRSVGAAERASLGFRPEGLAVVGVDLGMLQYDDARAERFFEQADQRFRAMPGVVSSARASRFPFSLNFNRSNIAVPGHQQSPDEMGRPIDSAEVSPSYFETLGVAVLQGRAFLETDRIDTPRVAVINETMARQYWPGESAVGELVYRRTLSSGQPLEIVGVVADHRRNTVGEAPGPAIFTSTAQSPSTYAVLAARTSGDDRALLDQMRRTLLSMEPDVLFLDSQTMKQQVSATLFPVRAAAVLVSAFSGVGLLLAAIGLYGVIAFSVSKRTREIGIRMAMGAGRADVLGMVMRQGLGVAAVGLIVGLGLASGAARVVAGALYGVGVGDPVAWGAAAVVLLGVTALANLVPARRAMRVDPAQALRKE
ncbi:MAG TPA: ABC transporter permease [Thermoanaerobaculia bacterium]|nr:ABC transporter permease [Thermoanaerobaculia bacterium]